MWIKSQQHPNCAFILVDYPPRKETYEEMKARMKEEEAKREQQRRWAEASVKAVSKTKYLHDKLFKPCEGKGLPYDLSSIYDIFQ